MLPDIEDRLSARPNLRCRPVSLGEANGERMDQGWRVVLGEPERPGAHVLAPQRQHDELGLVMPGDPKRAPLSADVQDHIPAGRKRLDSSHVDIMAVMV
jgi:hypothetical protein